MGSFQKPALSWWKINILGNIWAPGEDAQIDLVGHKLNFVDAGGI